MVDVKHEQNVAIVVQKAMKEFLGNNPDGGMQVLTINSLHIGDTNIGQDGETSGPGALAVPDGEILEISGMEGEIPLIDAPDHPNNEFSVGKIQTARLPDINESMLKDFYQLFEALPRPRYANLFKLLCRAAFLNNRSTATAAAEWIGMKRPRFTNWAERFGFQKFYRGG